MTTKIQDIARLAGVSPTTVSRVLNNNYPVKKETREKIESVIEELGYKPNYIARSLKSRKTSNIAVVVPGITNLFFPTIVEEINKTLVKEEFIISLFTTNGDSENERNVIGNITARNMDGIILLDPSVENLENGYLEGISKHTPTIIINGMHNRNNLNYICYNEEIGTIEAFEYFMNLGHKEIMFIRGEKSFSYDLKEKVYRKFVEDHQLKYTSILCVGKGNTLDVVYDTQSSVEKFFREGNVPTAIFACNDLMAVGALNACRSINVRVPEDVSIIGFDNTIVSDISNPRITTVDLNMRDIGKKAAKSMLYMIRKQLFEIDKFCFNTRLIYRESCKEHLSEE